jgi:hypothetical protein
LNSTDCTPDLPAQSKGGTPFETIRRVDAFGREYWSARELMPFLGYSRWQNFERVIDQAITAANVVGINTDLNFTASSKNAGQVGRIGGDYRLSRYGAYMTAMRGDSHKPEIAAALTYFAIKTREAELGSLIIDDIQRTALARAREMIDYRTFRDMMAENATDYEPSSRRTQLAFATLQNKLYQHITGMTASEIRGLRELETWPGRGEGKPEPSQKAACRGVAKNYLTSLELSKLNRMVARLCLAAEELAEDNVHLTLGQWEHLVVAELAMSRQRLAA